MKQEQSFINTDQWLQTIKDKWRHRTPGYLSRIRHGTAAVVIPLIETDRGVEILYEVRSDALTTQPGEVSFPGGKIEAGEKPEAAAVRETMEELMIEQDQIEILAPMDGENGPSGAPIWPFVGMLRDFEGTFSKDEVDHLFSIPINWFLKHEPLKHKAAMVTLTDPDFPYDLLPGGRDYQFKKRYRDILFYQTEEAVIWGVTAQMTYSFVQFLKSKNMV